MRQFADRRLQRTDVMRKLLDLGLGIVTSLGGFLEIGSIVTSAQAGAEFGFGLLWAVMLGGLCLVALVEMSGRFAAVTKRTIPGAMRERFGFNFFSVPLVLTLLVLVLVVAVELSGVAIALELATGVAFRWWIVPAALATWLLLWKAPFAVIEDGVSLLGLVTVAFFVAAVRVHPPVHDLLAGLVPHWPPRGSDGASRYFFLAVVILGASITPSLFYFYSAGAVEEKWGVGHLNVNRAVSIGGMTFGAVLSGAIMVLGAMVLAKHGLHAADYHELPMLLTPVLGKTGFWLVVAALGVACLGAAAEGALVVAYVLADGFGWNWSQNDPPHTQARYSLAYTATLALAMIVSLVVRDPLQVTVIAMALTAASLPFAVFPFLVLMNDKRWMRKHHNGWVSNVVVGAVMVLTVVLAVVTIPLQLVAGGS